MSLLVRCPTCGHTATFHRAPVQRCPQCESAYSEAIGVAAENALRHDLAPKPALLLIGQGICAFAGCLFLVFIPLAALNIGSYSIGNRPVTGAAFLRVGGPAFGLVGGWFAAIALGMWRDKPWSRPLMLAYWPVSTAVGIALVWNDPDLVMNFASACIFGAISMSIAGWYLYHKDSVVAYFDACARERKAAAGAPPPVSTPNGAEGA